MKKKIFLLFITVIILGSQSAFAQIDVEKEASLIRSGVLRTNKLLSIFKKTTKMIEGVSNEGTKVTFYKSTAGLKKIQAEIVGETYNAKADYYYSDRGELTFIYYRINRYDTQIGVNPPPKVVKKEEKRLYFKNGKMIKKVVTTTENKLSGDSANAEKEILELEKTFLDAIKK